MSDGLKAQSGIHGDKVVLKVLGENGQVMLSPREARAEGQRLIQLAGKINGALPAEEIVKFLNRRILIPDRGGITGVSQTVLTELSPSGRYVLASGGMDPNSRSFGWIEISELNILEVIDKEPIKDGNR